MAISTPEVRVFDESYDVAGNLTTYVNRIVKISAANQVNVCGAGEAGVGVLINYSDTDAAGKAAEVRHVGVANVTVNAQATPISAGDPLLSAADGIAVKAVTNKDLVIGIALAAATADGVKIPVLLTGLRTLSL